MPNICCHGLLVRLAMILALAACPGPSQAQPSGNRTPRGAGGPAGNTDNAAGAISREKPPGVVIPNCTDETPPPVAAAPPIAVTVVASSRWQPRGGEVLLEIRGDAKPLSTLTVRACFGWSHAGAADYFKAENLKATFKNAAFVEVRPTTGPELINLGVVVPQFDTPPPPFFQRWATAGRAVGFGIIPVADLRLIGYDGTGVVFDIVRPIGITSVGVAAAFTFAVVALGLTALYRFSGAAPPMARPGVRSWTGSFFRFYWVLALIRGEDGRASLASFQVMLWTVVIAASAIYVMSLSGELINVTNGALTLLGIAGGASVIAKTQTEPYTGPIEDPRWRNLVQAPRTEQADVSRMQMLFFTVVSAAFVALQVATSYVIPDIPAGYQVLMGISNGVYVGTKVVNKRDPTAT